MTMTTIVMTTLTRMMMAMMTTLPAGARPASVIAAFMFAITRRGGGAEQNIQLRQIELSAVAV